MDSSLFRVPRRFLLFFLISIIAGALPASLQAQDADAADRTPTRVISNTGRVYTPDDFSRFTPRNALDILERVPGFSINSSNQGRGLGQASTNVLINGERLSSKSQDIFDRLRRVTADNVERIEIVDGSTLDMPGLSGQVANVITQSGAISGSYEYRNMLRPKYAQPSWFGGELSTSGTVGDFEWSAAYTHGAGRGGAGGPGTVMDGAGNITEYRDIHLDFEGDFPRLSGSLKWTGPDDIVANLNAQYSRAYTDNSNDEQRNLVEGVNRFRDFDNSSRGHGYEVGGDIEFPFAGGTLKLIGLDRQDSSDGHSESRLIFADDTPTTGSRFASQSETGERIARAEYRWDMLGGDWEIDGEAAFNRFDRASRLYNLTDAGDFEETELPNASGEVTEDRYEMILTYGRTLVEGLTMQLGAGAENSTLAQSGPGGLTREFWRPKGSLSLAWTPNDTYDVSLSLARRVGQLSFGQFLAGVDLALGNANAGNVQLKPTLRWESNLQVKQNLGDWGSNTFQLYTNWYDDYIDIIPIPGGGESPGNIDSATLYGAEWNSTVNLDPMGWEGVRIDLNVIVEESRIEDPLTGVTRSFSNHYDRRGDISFRHDIPGTDWAWGLGIQYNHVLQSYRLSQVEHNYEGPAYTWAFVENKDVFGLTVNAQVFNLTSGAAIYHRTVYDGTRDTGTVDFIESRDLSVQPIFRLEVTGSF